MTSLITAIIVVGFVDKLKLCLPEGYAKLKYVVAVSGGVDSMVLLNILSRLIPCENLVVAHFNHKVRGEDASGDECFVRQWCKKRGITFVSHSRHGKQCSHEALRVERLAFLQRVYKEHGAHRIATGHHANDVLETWLMRLVRGTGILGLKSITPYRKHFVRPLFDFTKEEIVAFARREKIKSREDRTNLSRRYFRNRVRKDVVPAVLKAAGEFGTVRQFTNRFLSLCQEIDWANRHLEKTTRRHFQALVTTTPLFFRMPWEGFAKLHRQWQLRLLRRICRKFDVHVSRQGANYLCDRILAKKNVTGEQGIEASYSLGYLYFRNPGMKNIPVAFELCDRVATCKVLGLQLQLQLQLEKGGGDLEPRFFRPGDKMGGKKLKEIFLKWRVPKDERHLIPVLARRGSSDICWVYPFSKSGLSITRHGFPYAVRYGRDLAAQHIKSLS